MENKIDIVLWLKTESGDNYLNRYTANDWDDFNSQLLDFHEIAWVAEYEFLILNKDMETNKDMNDKITQIIDMCVEDSANAYYGDDGL